MGLYFVISVELTGHCVCLKAISSCRLALKQQRLATAQWQNKSTLWCGRGLSPSLNTPQCSSSQRIYCLVNFHDEIFVACLINLLFVVIAWTTYPMANASAWQCAYANISAASAACNTYFMGLLVRWNVGEFIASFNSFVSNSDCSRM